MKRIVVGSAVLALLVLAAGCLGGAPGAGSPVTSASPDSPAGTVGAAEQPDADKAVHVENRWNRSVEIRISVVRAATNETVYEETETFEAGADRDVYNLAEVSPEGVESFRITATARNTTESVPIETSVCYGNAYVEITEDGSLYPYYAIC